MSGTWSRKRRSAGTTSVPAPLSREPLPPRPPDAFPLPPAIQHQQILLSRSTERMFEDAELSGVLSLAGRKLKSFPTIMADKYDISDLVAADLSSNRLLDVPPDVCELRSLETLRICQNSLRRVPSNISLLQALVYLDLSNNQLSTLPSSLFELPLEILLLTGNRFEAIPREIRNLSGTLTELDLGHNFLKTIPADIALLKMLKVLNLKKNFLDQFPSELCRLSLSILDLSSNQFTQLPLHIRKMKTLIQLDIHDNPLQSPPTSIIEKGREHIFKWMAVQVDTSSGGGQMTPMRSSGTLRARDLGRSILVTSEETPMRKTSVPERRSRTTRFHTVTGSDSGYASTADEHRLSHELGPTVLDEVNEEYSVFSPSPDEGIQENETSSSESVSLKSQDSSSTSTEPPKPVIKTIRKSNLAPLATIEDSSPASTVNSRQTTPNGNLVVSEKKNSLDLRNNNTTKDVYSTPTAVVTPTIPTRPMSKVAPMVAKKISPTTISNRVTKPATISKISPPGSKAKPVVVIKKESLPAKRQPIVVPSQQTTRLPLATPSTSATNLIKKPEKKVESVSTLKKTSMTKSMTTETSTGLESFRKIFLDNLGLTLSSTKENISSQLADGIHLCNLMNALRPKSINSIQMGNDSSPLSPMKAKRNVDSFVSACKRAGLPENSVCLAGDVLAKKNLLLLVKTINALSRLSPLSDRIVTSV